MFQKPAFLLRLLEFRTYKLLIIKQKEKKKSELENKILNFHKTEPNETIKRTSNLKLKFSESKMNENLMILLDNDDEWNLARLKKIIMIKINQI